MLKIEMVQVAAVIDGNHLQLIDRRGRNIRKIKTGFIGIPDKFTIEKMNWCHVLEKQMNRLNFSLAKLNFDPWLRRAYAMSTNLRLRIKDIPLKGKRRKFDELKTKTWKEAALRMNEQAYRHFQTYLGCRWKKWAASVSKNQQRRLESRYGKNNYSTANT